MPEGDRQSIWTRSAAILREHLAETIEEGVRRTIAEIPIYASIPPDELRPSTTRGFESVAADLGDPAGSRFTAFLTEMSLRRAREGTRLGDILAIIALTEDILRDLFRRHVEDPGTLLAMFERVNAIYRAAIASAVDGFGQVKREQVQRTDALIHKMTTPILPIYDGVVVMPLIGVIDADRAARMLTTLLEGIAQHRASVLILDLTGIVPTGGQKAQPLQNAVRGGRLLGAEVIVVGMSPAIARGLVLEDVDLSGILLLGNLQAGLDHALSLRGLEVKPIRDPAAPAR